MNIRNKPLIRLCSGLAAGALLLASCTDVGYYAQCVSGHWQLMSQRRDIDKILNAPDTPEALAQRLRTVLEIRDFASQELLLPDNKSYRSYADLGRAHAVWNVVSTPEFSLEPVSWCFPVVGCVSYRGYFQEEDAREFAEDMRRRGHDVHLYGVPAYSTLSWFDDPVLNTFCFADDPRLAGLIFHELAHQLLYVKGDTAFSEAFAQTVEQVGVERWLESRGQQEQIEQYNQRLQRQKDFLALLQQTRSKLDDIYQSPFDPEAMRAEKARAINEFRLGYDKLRSSWGGEGGYDRWVEGPLNNAHFASVSMYHDLVPAFRLLLDEHKGDLSAFYRAVSELADLAPDERHQALDACRDETALAQREQSSEARSR
ncbi:aminopeptidase [Geoalkalibacter subterraneus]|uniref:aminopeptidase n=1 Tax=Geoalkalibacter subterraneus TaxID=483547 RepID=UPI000AB4D429|nr:aminopeptidase [Geoalkalibacter subterraneus]